MTRETVLCPICDSDDTGLVDRVIGDQGTGEMVWMCWSCGETWPEEEP